MKERERDRKRDKKRRGCFLLLFPYFGMLFFPLAIEVAAQ